MNDSIFSFEVKVYYEDTDAQGVVYYANYLKYFERTRTEWLQHCGVSVSDIAKQMKIGFVVRRVNVEYHAPAFLEQPLQVTLQPEALNRASMELQQNIYPAGSFSTENHLLKNPQDVTSADIRPLISSTVTLAAIHLDKLKPVKIPYEIFPAGFYTGKLKTGG